jgi:hypothetical protein
MSRKLLHSKIREHDQLCSLNFLLDFDMPLALHFNMTQSHYVENRELSPPYEYHNQQACPKTDEVAKDL